MSELQFTVDWTTPHVPVWQEMLARFKGQECSFLEIGAFEGRTTRWMCEHFLKCHIDVIDPFTGGADQIGHHELAHLRERFDNNTREFESRICVFSFGSADALLANSSFAASTQAPYDFIYIDGSHEARDVLFDACAAYHLCKPGGLICFDDYFWTGDPDRRNRPKMAIDAFLFMYREQIKLLRLAYQVWIQKK